ncbi:MAG: hypothetical protein GY723_19270 [bacterium]|nr:hypothetical protein [bacterium]
MADDMPENGVGNADDVKRAASAAKPRPMQKSIDASMRMTGRLHLFLCRIPGLGEPLARGMSWSMAIFPWLGGMRRTDSIAKTRQQLIDSGEQMGFPFQFSEVEGDQFVLELPYCPYGFTNSEHQRACDTAMDMDRILLRRCGAELTIEETIPEGKERCRMLVRQVSKEEGSDPS